MNCYSRIYQTVMPKNLESHPEMPKKDKKEQKDKENRRAVVDYKPPLSQFSQAVA